MGDPSDPLSRTPAWQRSIRDRCVHPAGSFMRFRHEDVEQSIPDRFLSCVRRDPDRLAVQSGPHALTYRELNGAANRVARAILRLRGEGPEPIALLFNHGVPFLTSILGVLKAGKLYVPLDPSYPLARLSYMLEDSQAPAVLTSGKDLALARQLAPRECHLVNVEELEPPVADEDLGVSIAPDARSYVIYTSGSTAQPKGVVQSHRNVLHKIMMSTNDYHLCAEDRRTLLYSPSSSGSVWEIFGALLNGGSLHLFDVREEPIANLASWLDPRGRHHLRFGPDAVSPVRERVDRRRAVPPASSGQPGRRGGHAARRGAVPGAFRSGLRAGHHPGGHGDGDLPPVLHRQGHPDHREPRARRLSGRRQGSPAPGRRRASRSGPARPARSS